MTDFTTGQFIDAVTNIKDAFLNIKKENDDLIETNKYLVMEIKRLEADLLQMTLEKKDGKLVSLEAKKEAEKKEKEAKKEAEKKEKEAKKEAEKKEKEAKKEEEKKEKEAKKEVVEKKAIVEAKKEVVEKKAIVEAIQIEETAAKKQSDQLLDGELSEEKVIVTKFTFEGKDYLRDEKNVVYDYNSQEEIGVWTGIMIELYDAELQHATFLSLWDKYEEKPKPSFTGQCVAQRPLENGTGTKPVYYADSIGFSAAAAAHARRRGIKKSLGQVKTNPSREPEYHMTKVARDWAS
jgi:chemotaxis protein histidine kinase CheA